MALEAKENGVQQCKAFKEGECHSLGSSEPGGDKRGVASFDPIYATKLTLFAPTNRAELITF